MESHWRFWACLYGYYLDCFNCCGKLIYCGWHHYGWKSRKYILLRNRTSSSVCSLLSPWWLWMWISLANCFIFLQLSFSGVMGCNLKPGSRTNFCFLKITTDILVVKMRKGDLFSEHTEWCFLFMKMHFPLQHGLQWAIIFVERGSAY